MFFNKNKAYEKQCTEAQTQYGLRKNSHKKDFSKKPRRKANSKTKILISSSKQLINFFRKESPCSESHNKLTTKLQKHQFKQKQQGKTRFEEFHSNRYQAQQLKNRLKASTSMKNLLQQKALIAFKSQTYDEQYTQKEKQPIQKGKSSKYDYNAEKYSSWRASKSKSKSQPKYFLSQITSSNLSSIKNTLKLNRNQPPHRPTRNEQRKISPEQNIYEGQRAKQRNKSLYSGDTLTKSKKEFFYTFGSDMFEK